MAVEYVAAAVGTEMTLTAGEILLASQIAVTAVAVGSMRMQQLNAEKRAKNAWNAGQRDRYVMVRGALQPRQVVLGSSRVSGPMVFAGSWGAKREHLAFVVPIAGHEVDAIDGICIEDEPVTLDAAGNVTAIERTETFAISAATGGFTLTGKSHPGSVRAAAWYGGTEVAVALTYGANTTIINVTGARAGEVGELRITYAPDPCPYVQTTVVSRQQGFSLLGQGPTAFAISGNPDPGSVAVIISARGNSPVRLSPQVTGNSVVVNIPAGWSGRTDGSVSITWQQTTVVSRLRVRRYLGTPGQLADAALMAAMPGQWSAAHRCDGVAYLVVEADYDRDAFSGGIPNVSAYVRGLKCLDPRTGQTAWTENPAICARGYAIHKLGGRLRLSHWDDAACIRAANACDTPTTYMLGGRAYPRPLYTCSLVAYTDQRPTDVLSDLCGAMGGDWIYANGVTTIAAGAWRPAVTHITEAWLQGDKPIQIQPDKTRSEFFNAVTGSFTDAAQNYKTLPFPRIAPPAYASADGGELPLSGGVAYPAVPFLGQAQYLASVAVRRVRQGLTVKLHCNMRAWVLEKYDNITLSLARFGWDNKPFEVAEIEFAPDGGHVITLQETDPSLWELDANYQAADPAPNTSLPQWSALPEVEGLTLSSGTAELVAQADGSIISRIKLSWQPVPDASITEGGSIELRYGLATEDESTWASVTVPGADTSVHVSPVHDGVFYLAKARAVSALSRGKWCPHVLHLVVGKTEPASPVTGLAATINPSAVSLAWEPNPDVDRATTHLRMYTGDVAATEWGLAGALWAWSGNATSYPWPRPSMGTYTILARHADRSGNLSTAAARLLIDVPASSGGTGGPVDWSDIIGAPDVDAAVQAAAGAANAAAVADDKATAANNLLAEWAADSTLSPVEKSHLKIEVDGIAEEATALDAQAAAYGITTELTACTDARNSLLSAVNPLLANLSAASAIDAPTVRGLFRAFYAARSVLLQRIAAVAGTRANWGSVSGVSVSTPQIAVGAVTFSAATNTAGGYVTTSDPSIPMASIAADYGYYTRVIQYSYTADVDCSVEILASVSAEYSANNTNGGLYIGYLRLGIVSSDNETAESLSRYTDRRTAPFIQNLQYFSWKKFSMQAGQTKVFSILANKNFLSDDCQITHAVIGIEVKKR